MKTKLFPFSTLTISDVYLDNYDSKTASRIVGVSLRQLQYWDEQNFLRPSIKLAGGRGTKRLYSFHDLVCLKVVKDLARYGFSLKKSAAACGRCRNKRSVGAAAAVAALYLPTVKNYSS